MISVSRNWPSRGFPSFKFSNRRSLFSHDTFILLFFPIFYIVVFRFGTKSMSMASSPRQTPRFFRALPFQSPFLPLASSRSSFHLRQDFRIMTKIWRAQRWFPSDTFRIFQAPPGERVFPLRQAGTRRRIALKSLSRHPSKGWLRRVEFTRKLNKKKETVFLNIVSARNDKALKLIIWFKFKSYDSKTLDFVIIELKINVLNISNLQFSNFHSLCVLYF